MYYSFLSYYKVIEAAHGGIKANVLGWINANLGTIRPYLGPERIAELQKSQADVANYLYVQNRCAVAHAANKPTADPDDPDHRRRLTLDLPIVEALARKAIDDGLLADAPSSKA